MTAQDMFGAEIVVGDLVVYATTSGKSPVQKFARVEVVKSEQKIRYNHQKVEGVWVRCQEEYTQWKVGVREISNGRGFRRSDSRRFHYVPDGDSYFEETPSKVRTTYPMIENMVKVSGLDGAA